MSPEQVAEQEGISLERGQENLAKILAKPTLNQQLNASLGITGNSGLKSLSPDSYPLSMAPARKPRSDKGVPKKPPAKTDEVVLRLNVNDARLAALAVGATDYCGDLASRIQDQIIAHLQKQIDALQKAK